MFSTSCSKHVEGIQDPIARDLQMTKKQILTNTSLAYVFEHCLQSWKEDHVNIVNTAGPTSNCTLKGDY